MSPLDIALLLQVLFFLVVTGMFLASGQASIFHPLTLYLAFHALVFVVRPLAVQYLGFNGQWLYMRVDPSETDLIRALAVSSCGLAVFAVCSLAAGWCRPEFRTASPAPFQLEERRALWIVTALLAPVIAYSMRSQLSGGMQGVLTGGGTFVLTGASGYTLEAQYMAGPLICAWLAVTRFRWPALLLLLPYIGYRSYVGISRWTMLLLLLAVVAMHAWQYRRKWPPAWAVICAIPVFFLFHALGMNRGAVQSYLEGGEFMRQTTQIGMSEQERLQAKYDGPDFANYDYLTYVTAMVPARSGTYTYGAQYLQLFTEPIPRKLWKGKPAGAPVGTFNLNEYGNFLGRTPALVGDGWMNGGWIGLVITVSIVGLILGCAHRWFWKHADNNMSALFYLVALAMLPQWYRDGSISIAKFAFWNLSPLFLWRGISWLLGQRLMPAASVVVPRNTSVRLIRATHPVNAEKLPVQRIVIGRPA